MKFNFTWKIWLLIIVLALSLISIFGIPSFEKGIVVTSIEVNSTAFEQGLRQGQIITAIDDKPVSSLEDYSSIMGEKQFGEQSVKTIFKVQDVEIILFSPHLPNITVAEIPATNLKLGLDLAGGSRALIQAEGKKLSNDEVNDLVATVSNRLNVYGIADVNVVPVSDLSGNNFMLVEIAGATPKDLQELISKQGKFEAKIGNETVFIGGNRDIASVCRNDATCAGIESCFPSDQGGEFCNFRFSIYLSEEAAERHANITRDLSTNSTAQGNYLSEKLNLYVDDTLVDSLLISEDLRGIITTQISISGSGSGTTRQEAIDNAEASMKNLQTVLITGSLPYKLEIVKLDTISPVLGKEFINAIVIAGVTALLAVAIVVFIRYRNFKSSLALLLTSFSEVIIILGVASLIEWNLDLPSIAGILATIGTGIDQQIIIMDEAKHSKYLSIKQRMKRAFAIILGAYFTALVSLLPLLWAGAGLLKGFAITTIIGITTGVLITRPAFTDIVKKIEDK
ncbi:MAG: preprotein translocase subunit SecD [Nanoarchaeota archaeon]|nr:preprotein translocase subunit SecD [Nanoarchaeota archaeon]